VLTIGKHRHPGEQQADIGAVVLDQTFGFDFLRRVDLMTEAVGDVVEVASRPARQQVGEASGPVLLIRREAPDDFHAVGVMTIAASGNDVVFHLEGEDVGVAKGRHERCGEQAQQRTSMHDLTPGLRSCLYVLSRTVFLSAGSLVRMAGLDGAAEGERRSVPTDGAATAGRSAAFRLVHDFA